jgi:hypothetical protein
MRTLEMKGFNITARESARRYGRGLKSRSCEGQLARTSPASIPLRTEQYGSRGSLTCTVGGKDMRGGREERVFSSTRQASQQACKSPATRGARARW